MKLQDILKEIQYSMYQTMVYVEFEDTTNITTIAQIIRSVQYVTVVNNKTDKEDLKPRGLLLIKVLTPKTGKDTFDIVQRESLKAIPELKKFKYSLKQLQNIEEV